MPLPIITDCYQIRFNWANVNAPRPASNVLHVSSSAHAGQETAIMAALNANVTAAMWTLNVGAINRVDITYLGTAAATQSFTPTTPLHWTGAGGTDMIPQGASVLTLQTATRGKSHRGRLFLPWIGEAEDLSGTLLAADVATAQAAWNTFTTNMATATFPLAVASVRLAAYTTVTSVLYRPYLKTQRRRGRR